MVEFYLITFSRFPLAGVKRIELTTSALAGVQDYLLHHSGDEVVVVVVSHIQRIGCQTKKTTLHGGQSHSWSAEQGKKMKNKKSGSAPPPPPPRALLVRKKN